MTKLLNIDAHIVNADWPKKTPDTFAALEAQARTAAALPEGAQKETPIHRIADKHEPAFTVAVQYAFARGRAAVKGVPSSLAADTAAKAVHDAINDVMPKTLLKPLTEAGVYTIKHLAPSKTRAAAEGDDPVKADWRFDVNDPRAIEWAKEHAAELAKGISDTTRDDIAAAIAQALEDGTDPTDAIAEAVGDDARAEMIARTEVMSASNEGQRQGWDQAVDNGLLPDDAKRVWIASEVGACDDCDELDGETADLDGDYPGDGADGPPLHPNCRCTEGIANE